MREQPFGRKRSDRTDHWVDLGSRYERFESQPPKDDKGDFASLTFRQRTALRAVQHTIDTLSNAHASAGSGRRIGLHLPSPEQRRYEKWWRGQVASILSSNQAAEASAQVISLTPVSGMRRAA